MDMPSVELQFLQLAPFGPPEIQYFPPSFDLVATDFTIITVGLDGSELADSNLIRHAYHLHKIRIRTKRESTALFEHVLT